MLLPNLDNDIPLPFDGVRHEFIDEEKTLFEGMYINFTPIRQKRFVTITWDLSRFSIIDERIEITKETLLPGIKLNVFDTYLFDNSRDRITFFMCLVDINEMITGSIGLYQQQYEFYYSMISDM